MAKLFNKSNIFIKSADMPNNILSYYVQICDTSYLLLNTNLDNQQELAAYKTLSYYYLTGKSSGILTLEQYETNSHPSVNFELNDMYKLSAIS